MLTIEEPTTIAAFPRPHASDHPEWRELSGFAWECAGRHIRTTQGRRHMDVGWDAGRNLQWVWDSCFMALFARYAPEALPGMASLDNFYDRQRGDGFIGMCYDMDTGIEPWPDRLNPPLFAWAEWNYWRSTGDASRLPRVLGHIGRLMDWVDANRRTEPHRRLRANDGEDAGMGESIDNYQLYWFEDCGSSGMDDSPRTPRLPAAGRFFDWIDLSSQMALSFRLLAELHNAIGDSAAAARWKSRHEETAGLINAELWCERTGFYHDRMIPANFAGAKTAAGFWPLLAGICPADRAAILAAHLTDPKTFGSLVPVPSLSLDDPNYDPQGTYWRGAVWAPTNYMVLRGLAENGHGDLAHQLAVRYLDALAKTYAEVEPPTLWECNAPEAFKPGLQPYIGGFVRRDFVGWSGLGPTAIFIENVLGFDVDAPQRTVTWHIRLMEEHGVESLPIDGGHHADFHCTSRNSASDPAIVTVKAEASFDLILHHGKRTKKYSILPGVENCWSLSPLAEAFCEPPQPMTRAGRGGFQKATMPSKLIPAVEAGVPVLR